MLRPRCSSHVVIVFGAACLAATFNQANALVMDTRWPIHSYYEGLRGRLALWTPATSDDPLALWINPALLATGKTAGFGYLRTYNDSAFSGDDAFAISLGNLAFGAELMDLRETPVSLSTKRANRYTLASGQKILTGVYFGTAYSWHSSEISELDDADTWSAGLLVRPNRMLSVGVVGRDLNSPTYYGNKFKPMVETSLGFRPAGERLTVFANYLARDRRLPIHAPGGDGAPVETQPKSFFTYGIEVEPAQGLLVRVGADEDENVSACASLSLANFGMTSLITRGKSSREDKKIYGTGILTVSPFWHDSALMPDNGYLEIDLSGRIGEARPRFSLLGGGPRRTLRELLEKIDRAKRTPEIRAIVLKCNGASASFAVFDELRQALTDFRASGKQVVAYTETPRNGEYYLASACDCVVLMPNGYLGLVGLKAEIPFIRGTLDKLGIEAKYTKTGEYKSAVEILSQDQYSQPSREAENALLDDIYAKFVADIAEGREMTEDEVREAIDKGPYTPQGAFEAGLIDTAAYWDEVPDIVEKVLQAGSRSITYEAFARRNYQPARWDDPPTVGIVYAVGSIAGGENRRDMLFGEIMGSETMTEAIRTMREDRSVRAVILRVDSPGGEMWASDMIRREIEITKMDKPVVVSMGGVAASGGYHISCSGTKILADETTVTGSIGVFSLWLHTRGLYQKLGVNKEIFTRGKHADPMPTWRDPTEEDMRLMQDLTDSYYRRFVTDVSAGRGRTYDDIHEIAQGRVWSGKAALANGLIDGIGGLKAAIDLAKMEAGIPPDEQVNFKVLPRPAGLLETIMSRGEAGLAARLGFSDELRNLIKDSAYATQFDEPLLYLMPYQLEIE